MENKITGTNKVHRQEDTVVIPDECGDSMWAAVLQQHDKSGQLSIPPVPALLVQVLNESQKSN